MNPNLFNSGSIAAVIISTSGCHDWTRSIPGGARNDTNKLNFLCALVFQQRKSFACAVSSGKHWIDKNDLGEHRDYNIPA
jgi:hypothetical protein